MSQTYVVCDVETTGGNADSSRIIEIALVKIENNKITDTFQTLVNPGIKIPPFITQLTGITDSMVKHAPRFSEIAEDVLDFLGDAHFVAHNARFDYSMLKKEFARIGIHFERTIIDTLALSREYFPDLPKYKLQELANWLELPLEDHHRALSDALATAHLLLKILFLQENSSENHIKQPWEDLPEKNGIFYFFDKNDTLIFLDHHPNVKKGVTLHLRSKSKANKFIQEHYQRLDFKVTNSELISTLLAWAEEKSLHPLLPRKNPFSGKFGIYSSIDEKGYIHFRVRPFSSLKELPFALFDNVEEARHFLLIHCSEHRLCETYCHLTKEKPCPAFFRHECQGACIGQEPPDAYNVKAETFMKSLLFNNETLLLIEKFQTNLSPIIYIENGIFKGYGYLSPETNIHLPYEIENYTKPINFPSLELTKLLKITLQTKKISYKIIKFRQLT